MQNIWNLEQLKVKSKFLNRFFFQLVTYLRFLQYIGTIKGQLNSEGIVSPEMPTKDFFPTL